MWFNWGQGRKQQQKQQKQIDTLEAHLSLVKKRLREVKRELFEFKQELGPLKRGLGELGKDRQDLIIKVSRIEGALGIFPAEAEQQTPTKDIEAELRYKAEREEQEAIEQLGTGGGAQNFSPPSSEEEEED